MVVLLKLKGYILIKGVSNAKSAWKSQQGMEAIKNKISPKKMESAWS